MKDVKLFAFLKAQIASGRPERYPALVTDVRNFGFFVDVPGLAMSGLVPLSTVADDFYIFDAQRNLLVGRRRRLRRRGAAVTSEVGDVDDASEDLLEGTVVDLDLIMRGEKGDPADPVELIDKLRRGEDHGGAESSAALRSDGHSGMVEQVAEGRDDIGEAARTTVAMPGGD